MSSSESRDQLIYEEIVQSYEEINNERIELFKKAALPIVDWLGSLEHKPDSKIVVREKTEHIDVVFDRSPVFPQEYSVEIWRKNWPGDIHPAVALSFRTDEKVAGVWSYGGSEPIGDEGSAVRFSCIYEQSVMAFWLFGPVEPSRLNVGRTKTAIGSELKSKGLIESYTL